MLDSKKFDEYLQIENVQILEDNYQNTKNIFLNSNYKIKYDEVPLKYPAFCDCKQFLFIKFPTYKIRIFNNNSINIDSILNNINNYEKYEEHNVFKYNSPRPIKSTSIHCLDNSLDKNKELAEKIQYILKENGIYSEKFLTLGYLQIPIDVDDKGYIYVKNNKI